MIEGSGGRGYEREAIEQRSPIGGSDTMITYMNKVFEREEIWEKRCLFQCVLVMGIYTKSYNCIKGRLRRSSLQSSLENNHVVIYLYGKDIQ